MISQIFFDDYWLPELIISTTLTLSIIFLERKNPKSAYAWILLVWIKPLLGFVLYLFFSQNLTRRKIYKYNATENNAYHVAMDLDPHMSLDRAKLAHLPHHRTIEYHMNASSAYYSSNNDIILITDGHEKFDALFDAIEKAKTSIHLEYYIFKNDTIGTALMDLLIKRAKDGIDVRLLTDEMGSFLFNTKKVKELQAAGGHYGRFFPSKIRFLNPRINYRCHRKIVVIDGQIGFIGGFNVGDEYLGENKKMGYWRDTHLRVTGSVVHELQHRFILDWQTTGKTLTEHTTIKSMKSYYPTSTQTEGVGAQLVVSGPDSILSHIKHGFLRMISGASKHIYIQTPYFVPDESIMEALKIALASGIDVFIMIPNKPDHIFIYWATLSHIGELIECGAKVYIYNNGFLHAKVITVDDQVSSVGTCNFDIRSFSLNFESNLFIYDEKIASDLRETFLMDIEDALYYDIKTYTNRSRAIKMKESVSRLVSPLL